ncbi:MAG: hypothetical protein EZS28_017658 [Streblomastix strix]|uniref:RNase III domain-containing protein n=1 Tax=Streblomastix strix TaxID=222440 RepID=A0A5J4VXC7_9EUKA|nr:MAG: hypothetical protein EZS28_017658 [Streblomastix strix]
MAIVVFGDLREITGDELIALFLQYGTAILKQKRENSAIILMSSVKAAAMAQRDLNDTIQYGIRINVSAELVGFLKELKPDILKECFRFGESNFEVGEFYGDAVLEYRCVCNRNLESVFNRLQFDEKLLTRAEQDYFRFNNWKKKADFIECLIGTLYKKSNRGIKQQSPEELLCNYALIRLLDEIYNQVPATQLQQIDRQIKERQNNANNQKHEIKELRRQEAEKEEVKGRLRPRVKDAVYSLLDMYSSLKVMREAQGLGQNLDLDVVTDIVTTEICDEVNNPELILKLSEDKTELVYVVNQKIFNIVN